MNNYRITFWTSSHSLKNVPADFGCSVHGFANSRQWTNPQEPLTGVWDESLRGTLASGNYDSVLKTLSVLSFKPKVCIVLFSKPTGIESFIDRLIQIMPSVPLIGGGAAFADGPEEGELMPPGGDVTLLAVEQGNYDLESLNIFDKNDFSIEIKKTSLRDFEQLRVLPDGGWQSALDYFHRLQTSLGLENSNFESVTFCDKNDRNIHFSKAGNSLHAGANLPDDDILFLRILNNNHIEERVASFMSDNRALIFGCAGIRSLIKIPILTGNNSLAGFMFGELVMLNHTPMFGNLMLAKLRVK